jgi:KDO2-lipid IV(A) lauroyltransferase
MTWLLWPFRWILLSLHALPKSVRVFLGRSLGLVLFHLIRLRRGTVFANLRLAYPERDAQFHYAVARGSYVNMGQSLVEYCHLPFMDEEWVDRNFEFVGMDHWSEAKARNRGLCLLTLHLGNGDLANAALSIKGFTSHLISKEFKLKWLNDLWFGVRRKHGTAFIPPRNSSYRCLKALHAGDAVIFVLDQFMGPPIGVKTTFFGVPTGTALGLAVMASRTGSPIVPIYTFRRADGRHVVCCEPEIPFEELGSKEETQRAMTQKFNDVLEGIVRKHPDQWMWIHRRWKRFKV